MADLSKLDSKKFVQTIFDKSLTAQRPLALKYVARLRRVHPNMSPSELVGVVNAWYLTTVTATGAASGASAFVPNAVVQIPVAVGDLATFLEASIFYTLTVAEIHGLHPEDLERRRLLVMVVLLGDSALTSTTKGLLGRTVPFWGKQIVDKIPMTTINAINKVLGPRFITKYGTKQGVLVLGKQIPLGIGIVVGAGGNHTFGWLTIRAAKKFLGAVPATWEHMGSPGGLPNDFEAERATLDADDDIIDAEVVGDEPEGASAI